MIWSAAKAFPFLDLRSRKRVNEKVTLLNYECPTSQKIHTFI
jgi:hypothetical protein